jgi:hypothetical protein
MVSWAIVFFLRTLFLYEVETLNAGRRVWKILYEILMFLRISEQRQNKHYLN